MVEDAKVRVLFDNLGLKDVIAALEVQHDIGQMSCQQITNHLVTKISQFDGGSGGKFKGRNLSETKTGQRVKSKGLSNGSIHIPDGNIWAGFYSNWK